jgi:ABC-type sugar transport system substrate-binding protein
MSKVFGAVLAAALACGMVTASPQVLAADGKDRPLNVVFVNPGKTGEVYWDMVSSTMKAAGSQLGISLETLQAERNSHKMQELGIAVTARTRKPDFLVLVNEESAALPIMKAAEAVGIRTLLLSNTFGPDAAGVGSPRQNFKMWIGDITADLDMAGARMANALFDAARAGGWQSADGKIHILAIGGDETTPASIERNNGLMRAAAAAADVTIDRMVFANWNADEAERVTASYLAWAARKNIRVAGIWAGNDPMALGAIKAAGAANLQPGKDLQVVGLNWSVDALEQIGAGRLLLSDGGHFLLGGWSMVLLRDFADGCDFAAATSHLKFKTSAITRANLSPVNALIRDRAFDRIDFASFRAMGNCGVYDFSVEALVRSLSAASGG